MSLSVNTNHSSLNAQRQLLNTSNALSKSFERLSSGLRINGAKDDAAGLSISTRFSAQIRGLNQAVRNSNDGISLAQTAEGALNETTNILQRIRELSVQAANDTNNDSDRASLQAEVAQLKSELDRIAETTNFNGNKVLDGTFLAKEIQVGANVGETLSISIDGARTKDLARQARYSTDTQVTADALAANDLEIIYRDADSATGYSSADIRATTDSDDQLSTSNNASSAIAKATAINSLSEITGVRAIVEAATTSGADLNATMVLNTATYFELNGAKITGFTVQENDADGALVSAINAVSDETGVIASFNSASQLILTAEDGRNIESKFYSSGVLVVANSGVTSGKITLVSEELFELDGNNIGYIGFGAGVYGVNSLNSVEKIDISERSGAVKAIDIVDLALEHVSASRAKLGALQNRLESTINNLSTNSENLSASRSRILDADFAQETAQLSRNQIIQQAGVSILAQANQQPQIALALLG